MYRIGNHVYYNVPSGNLFKCLQAVLYYQPMYDPIYLLYLLTFSPLIEGCSEGLDVFIFFFKQQLYYV